MTDQLAAIQTHLWVLTCMLAVILLANAACNYWHTRDDSGYRRMKRLWEAENHTELLVYTSQRLERSPANSLQLMYKAMALLALGRLDEAKAAAQKFKDVSPTMRTEAVGLLETIEERLAGEGKQFLPADAASRVGLDQA